MLEEKQIPYQYVEVNPYHKPQSLLKLNPRGLVPTLEYDGKPLYESTVVAEFLEDAYPNTKSSLRPKDPYDTARMRIWSDYITSRIIPAFHRFLQYQPHSEGSTNGMKEVQTEYLNHLKEFTSEMHPEGPFFMGNEPMLIDFILAPWAVRHWVFDHFKGGSGIPKSNEAGVSTLDSKVWARWNKWLNAIKDRPSVKETTSETEHYMPIYQRYAEDRAQSELAKATRKGRGVP